MKMDNNSLYICMEDNWIIYASQIFEGKLLEFKINGNGIYLVTYGETQRYRGDSRVVAVDVWNNI